MSLLQSAASAVGDCSGTAALAFLTFIALGITALTFAAFALLAFIALGIAALTFTAFAFSAHGELQITALQGGRI